MSLYAPVGWEYQHVETGLITVCINDGVNDRDSFEQLNPRHLYIGPLYRHPVQADDAMVERALEVFSGGLHNYYPSGYCTGNRESMRAALNVASTTEARAREAEGLLWEVLHTIEASPQGHTLDSRIADFLAAKENKNG